MGFNSFPHFEIIENRKIKPHQNPEGMFSHPGSAGEGLSIAGQTVAGNFPIERFYDDQHRIIVNPVALRNEEIFHIVHFFALVGLEYCITCRYFSTQ